MTIKEIYNYLNKVYPFSNAEQWDKVGLQLGQKTWKITKVVVTLDLTNDVIKTAKIENANLIITHHPFLFEDEISDDLAASPYKKKILDDLKKHNIALIALHTNYDKTNKQTATVIANKLKLKPLVSSSQYGHLFNQKVTSAKLQTLLEQKLGLKIINTNLKPNFVYHKWGLLPGAGDPKDIVLLHNEGAQFVITSNIKWSTWLTAKNSSLKLVEVSHAIEDLFTNDVATLISEKWKMLKVIKKPILR